MKTTIADVAALAGLSVVTVSRVINGATTVREKNRRKVEQAIRELNYRPSSAARILARGKTGVVGLLITHIADSFINELVYSINRILEENDYFLALSILPHNQSVKDCYLFTPDRADGIILSTTYNERQYVNELKSRNIPLLLIDNNQQYHDISTVSVDNFKGGYEVAKHLIKLGHKKIAHISGPDTLESSRQRKAGFIKGLQGKGLKPFALIKGDYSVLSGYKAACQWVKKRNLPDAVFAADDQTAFGVIDAFRENKIKVPSEVSVAGYDNHPFARSIHPFLTTVSQPTEELARISVELLLDQINSKNKQIVKMILKPNLIIRQSTCQYKNIKTGG